MQLLEIFSGPNRFSGYIIVLTTKTRTYVLFIMGDHVDLNNIAGAQYAGVHFSTLGAYTGEDLILS